MEYDIYKSHYKSLTYWIQTLPASACLGQQRRIFWWQVFCVKDAPTENSALKRTQITKFSPYLWLVSRPKDVHALVMKSTWSRNGAITPRWSFVSVRSGLKVSMERARRTAWMNGARGGDDTLHEHTPQQGRARAHAHTPSSILATPTIHKTLRILFL